MYQPELVQVITTVEYTVYLYYDDGNVRLYDAKPLIDKGGVFELLKDLDVFSVQFYLLILLTLTLGKRVSLT